MRTPEFALHVRDACHSAPASARGGQKILITAALAWLKTRRSALFLEVPTSAFHLHLVEAHQVRELTLDGDHIRLDGFGVDQWRIFHHDGIALRELEQGDERSVRRRWRHLDLTRGWAELRQPGGQVVAASRIVAVSL